MANSAFNPTLTVFSSGTNQQGEINVITNPIAQTDLSGWTTSNVTLNRVATGSPLDPEIPSGFQAASTTTTSSYVSTALQTVATSLRNRKLKVQFYLSLSDSSSWKVDVFKSDGVTRYPLSTDSSSVTIIPALTGTFTTTFDMDNGSGIYVRFTRYSGAGTSTLNFTNLIVGPGIQPQGAAVQAPIAYTPSTDGFGTVTGMTAFYSRRGSYLKVEGRFTSGTVNANTAYVSFPSGLNVDTSVITSNMLVGKWWRNNATPGVRKTGALSTDFTSNANILRFTSDDYTTGAAPATPLAGNSVSSSGEVVWFDFELPIAEWAGSGTVNLAQNDVEYVWNSDPGVAAGTTYSNSVYYGYGPNGTSIVSVNSTTASGESKTLYTVQFQTPVQAGDQVDVELNDGNGWFNAAQRFSPITNNATSYGILLVAINSTTYRVAFGNAGFNSSNATTYGAVGSSWSSLSGWRWRVRKASAGAAVGFGIVVPGTSAGLVSASGVPGNTTGNAIASGFVGEWIFATPASAVTFGTTGVVFNITSLALTAGTWLVYGNFTINPATATMTASYGGVSTSSTSFDSLTYVVGGQHTTTTNTYYASLPRVIRTTGTTMYLNGNVSYSGTAGTYSTTSSIQAIRIA